MSDPMQHPFQFPPSFSSTSSTPSAVDDGQNQQFIIQQIISSSVDEISRTQNITAEQRGSLQVLANFNSNPLQEILRLNLHIHATMFKLENKMNGLEQKLVDMLNQEQVSKQVITGDQRATMHATVKEHLVQTGRIQWDVAQEVIDFLEVHQVRFGFESVFASPKLTKDLQRETRRFATGHRDVLRIIIRNSAGLTREQSDLKACLSKTVEDIARRFLNTPSTRVPTEFYIFVALLRYIASENPAWINRGDMGRPQAGKDWWAGVAAWYQEKTKLWGNDWNVGEWVDLIQFIIANERTLHPEDPIPRLPSVPSIPVNHGVLPPTLANTEYVESSPTASMDHMNHAPVGSNTAGYPSFQYYNQASGSSLTSAQYYPQVNRPSQPSVYSPDMLYQNSSYY
ncbi:hypothetical protein M422DRAFT_253845 [Sphaerobolus stellatus SS14]|uniref:Uncharacterized protein n=1 Tax=Sphaerobolus stellatus (strain SS14) TaxID=990650 RepID=A0A0C9VXC7_SPHS4|nr:hypothetical protein M422DRAFT_253845 [Sphaerobolus stellatus SS14]